MTQIITPKVREALLLALHTPGHRLVRGKGGYVRQGAPQAGSVTIRTANAMQAGGLVEFDQPMFPACITLTPDGIAAAGQLVRAEHAKAGAA